MSEPVRPLDVTVFTAGPFAENTYLVRCTSTNRAVVVDPGAAADQALAEVRRRDATLDAIYLTHAHLDHVEGIPEIRAFADVPIHLHPADRPLYEGVPAQAAAFGLRLQGTLPPPDEDLTPGTSIPVGDQELEVRFAPGHAPGHTVFIARTSGLALVGDVIFHRSIGRTDLPGGDFQQLIRSIREEILTLPDAFRLLPGHGPETTVEGERYGNPFLISQAPGAFA